MTKSIEEYLEKLDSIKIKLILKVEFYNIKTDKNIDHFIHSTYSAVFKSDDIEIELQSHFNQINNHISDPEIESETGWRLNRIYHSDLYVDQYSPINASSYIDLPKVIKNKKAIINVKNEKDNECFKWSVLSALHQVDKDPQRLSKYIEFKDELNFNNITFPVKLDDYKKFERQNDISINVFEYKITLKKKIDSEIMEEILKVYPIYITKQEKTNHVDLLIIKDELMNTHYCWIKDFEKLVSNQISKNEHRLYICKRCLVHFSSQLKLDEHKTYCCKNEPKKILCPGEDSIKFKNTKCLIRIPFAIYADFESILKTIYLVERNPDAKSYTNSYQKHEPIGFGYQIISDHEEYKNYSYQEYIGEKPDEVFIDKIKEVKKIVEIYQNPEKMLPLTNKQRVKFEKAKICHICEKEFEENQIKVRDHDHITGKYRGPAHQSCNLELKFPNGIPVIFHNLSNYDLHLFIKVLSKKAKKIDIIPRNEERIITAIAKFSGIKLKVRFIDSFRFMSASLDSLAKNLNLEDLINVKKQIDPLLFNIISDKNKRKGIYPYDYLDSEDKMNETNLPTKDRFYSKLNKSHITDEEYNIALGVWNTLKEKTLRQYTKTYMKLDVLLLADIFENFRKICFKTYEMDPLHFCTSPSLSWNAMLRKTQIELPLITYYDIYMKFEQNIRGGVSFIGHGHSIANNPYMENFDPNKPIKYILDLDMNNLYGTVMTKSLPYKNIRYDNKSFNINKYNENSKIGAILGVDLEIPTDKHDYFKDFPFAAEHRNGKLCLTLEDKFNYGIHISCLKYFVSKGLILKKVHWVILFDQKPWMKPYIDLNTEKRREASVNKNKFEEDFYKLMSNSVYGKTMENVRKRQNIKLCNNGKQVSKLIMKPTYKHRTVIDENMILVHMLKNKIKLDKPIYVGWAILELAKLEMYKFWYDVIKPYFGDKAKLLMSDTDSLCIEFTDMNPYEFIKNNSEHFDLSNYSDDHFIFEGINKAIITEMKTKNEKRLGKMKDELGGIISREFVGIKSKMYALDNTKKLKGIKTSVVKNEITIDDYKKMLKNNEKIYKTMNVIRSRKHEIYSETINKTALSSPLEDNKNYVDSDAITRYPWGHYKIPYIKVANKIISFMSYLLLIQKSRKLSAGIHEFIVLG
jgi:hypothetical protein